VAERVPDVTPPAPDAHAAPGRVRVFGEWLATDRSLPGLPVSGSGDGQLPFWTLRTHDASDAEALQHPAGAAVAGRHPYANDVVVTLSHGSASDDIVISDTGRYSLAGDATTIVHHAPRDADRSAVTLDLIGVVLPYALHRRGDWCLHASAVETGDGVVAFLAERGTGKSTLAAACMRRGCALVADDVVVLRPAAHGVQVTPTGLPIRLRAETARAVGVDAGDVIDWGKVRIDGRPVHGARPLVACYLLVPAAEDAMVERASRTTRAAALALLSHGKITELLGAAGASTALSRCVDLAHHVPMWDITVPRTLDRIAEVTDALLAWHGGVPLAGSRA
jgi:hypothetical protein